MHLFELEDTPWRELASCQHHDADTFFPAGETGQAARKAAEAKAVCDGCPVALDCLYYAVSTGQRFGIWGGTGEDDRRRLRRRWVAAQRAVEDVDLVEWLTAG